MPPPAAFFSIFPAKDFFAVLKYAILIINMAFCTGMPRVSVKEDNMEAFKYHVQPGRYRHFKGNEYEVLGMARHSETEEEMVVYPLWRPRPLGTPGGHVVRDRGAGRQSAAALCAH